jgi:hypothetical protein
MDPADDFIDRVMAAIAVEPLPQPVGRSGWRSWPAGLRAAASAVAGQLACRDERLRAGGRPGPGAGPRAGRRGRVDRAGKRRHGRGDQPPHARGPVRRRRRPHRRVVARAVADAVAIGPRRRRRRRPADRRTAEPTGTDDHGGERRDRPRPAPTTTAAAGRGRIRQRLRRRRVGRGSTPWSGGGHTPEPTKTDDQAAVGQWGDG